MAGGVITVEGYREVDRAFRQVDRAKDVAFRREFAKAGEVVAVAFRGKISKYTGASLATVQSKALASGVFVVQNANKVTGKRGDYGSLQMRHLLAARAEKTDQTIEALEGALDRVIVGAGLG